MLMLEKPCLIPILFHLQSLRIEFIDFDIEDAYDCKWDSVTIYDGSDANASILGKYCGYTPPDPVETSGPVVFLKFRSDQYVKKRGFEARVTIIAGIIDPSYNDGISSQDIIIYTNLLL